MLRKNTSKHKQKFLQGNTHFQIIKRVRTFLEYFCNIFSKLKLKYLLVCAQKSLTDSPVAKVTLPITMKYAVNISQS